jgi:hypothetical protein
MQNNVEYFMWVSREIEIRDLAGRLTCISHHAAARISAAATAAMSASSVRPLVMHSRITSWPSSWATGGAHAVGELAGERVLPRVAGGDIVGVEEQGIDHGAVSGLGSLSSAKPSSSQPVTPPIMSLTGRPSWARRIAPRCAPLQCGPAQ